MRKMRILLSYGMDARENYVNAFRNLGADPTGAFLPEVDLSYDGLVICGGSDIHPRYYNEPIDGSVNIMEDRDAAEFALVKAYAEAGKPIFGICRGHQLINIFFGGSLHQDIPEAALHKKVNGVDSAHLIRAVEGSVLHQLYGETFSVNSSHHQAVKVLGEGLRATASWKSQYVEASEHTTLPILSVQYHPERMCFEKARPDTVDGSALLKYFIELCEKHAN